MREGRLDAMKITAASSAVCWTMLGQDLPCRRLPAAERTDQQADVCRVSSARAYALCRTDPQCIGVVLSPDGARATLKAEHRFVLLPPELAARCAALSQRLRGVNASGNLQAHGNTTRFAFRACDENAAVRWARLGCAESNGDGQRMRRRAAAACAAIPGRLAPSRVANPRRGANGAAEAVPSPGVGGESWPVSASLRPLLLTLETRVESPRVLRSRHPLPPWVSQVVNLKDDLEAARAESRGARGGAGGGAGGGRGAGAYDGVMSKPRLLLSHLQARRVAGSSAAAQQGSVPIACCSPTCRRGWPRAISTPRGSSPSSTGATSSSEGAPTLAAVTPRRGGRRGAPPSSSRRSWDARTRWGGRVAC